MAHFLTLDHPLVALRWRQGARGFPRVRLDERQEGALTPFVLAYEPKGGPGHAHHQAHAPIPTTSLLVHSMRAMRKDPQTSRQLSELPYARS